MIDTTYLKKLLEHEVDLVGLTSVLDALSDVCGAKAEHLQDETSRLPWARMFLRLASMATTAHKEGLNIDYGRQDEALFCKGCEKEKVALVEDFCIDCHSLSQNSME